MSSHNKIVFNVFNTLFCCQVFLFLNLTLQRYGHKKPRATFVSTGSKIFFYLFDIKRYNFIMGKCIGEIMQDYLRNCFGAFLIDSHTFLYSLNSFICFLHLFGLYELGSFIPQYCKHKSLNSS